MLQARYCDTRCVGKLATVQSIDVTGLNNKTTKNKIKNLQICKEYQRTPMSKNDYTISMLVEPKSWGRVQYAWFSTSEDLVLQARFCGTRCVGKLATVRSIDATGPLSTDACETRAKWSGQPFARILAQLELVFSSSQKELERALDKDSTGTPIVNIGWHYTLQTT